VLILLKFILSTFLLTFV